MINYEGIKTNFSPFSVAEKWIARSARWPHSSPESWKRVQQKVNVFIKCLFPWFDYLVTKLYSLNRCAKSLFMLHPRMVLQKAQAEKQRRIKPASSTTRILRRFRWNPNKCFIQMSNRWTSCYNEGIRFDTQITFSLSLSLTFECKENPAEKKRGQKRALSVDQLFLFSSNLAMFRIASTVCRRITSFKVPCRSFCQAEYELPKNLSKRQVASLKKMERKIGKEQERVRTVKKRNVYTGLALGGLVFSICKLLILFDDPLICFCNAQSRRLYHACCEARNCS